MFRTGQQIRHKEIYVIAKSWKSKLDRSDVRNE